MFASYENRWWIAAACTLGLVVVAGTINSFALAVFLKPISEDLGLSRSVVASGIMLANVICGVTTPFMGLAADRWGSHKVLLPGIPLFATSIAAFAFLDDSLVCFYSMFAAAGLLGAAQNTVPYTKVISNWFDKERGRVLGTALSGIGFGIAVVPQAALFLIQLSGWRTACFGVAGIIILLAFLPVLLFVRDPQPEELPGNRTGLLLGEVPGLTAYEVFTRQRRFWAMTAAFFLSVIATNATIVHVVAMLTDRGMSADYATAVLSTAGAGVILGRIGCGACLDRFHGPLVAICFYIVPALGIACLATELAGFVPFLGAAMCGVGLGANNTVMAYFVGRYFGLRAYGKVFGVMFGVFLIGSGIGPYLSALSYDFLHSYEPALIAAIGCLIGTCLLFATLGAYEFLPRGVEIGQQPPTRAIGRDGVAPSAAT